MGIVVRFHQSGMQGTHSLTRQVAPAATGRRVPACPPVRVRRLVLHASSNRTHVTPLVTAGLLLRDGTVVLCGERLRRAH